MNDPNVSPEQLKKVHEIIQSFEFQFQQSFLKIIKEMENKIEDAPVGVPEIMYAIGSSAAALMFELLCDEECAISNEYNRHIKYSSECLASGFQNKLDII